MKNQLIHWLSYCGALFLFLNSLEMFAQVSLELEPNPFRVGVEETEPLNVKPVDPSGNAVEGGQLYFLTLRRDASVPTSGIEVDTLGNVTGRSVGATGTIPQSPQWTTGIGQPQ